MVDKEKLARLAQALDDRADNKVAQEAERAAQAEADLQAHSNETRDMLGGKSLKYLTQAEYDILSDEEKNKENVIYYITDLEDRTHDHYNKEILDMLDEEFVKNLGKGQILETHVPIEEGWYRVASVQENGTCLLSIRCEEHGDYMVMIGNGIQDSPNMMQLGMNSIGTRRNNVIRVVHNPNALEAYLELHYTYSDHESCIKMQILGESEWKLMEPEYIDSVDETIYSIKEMNLVPGKIVGEFEGVIDECRKLAEARSIIVGNSTKLFDGTEDISFTLNEIGAAPRQHEGLTTENKIVVDAINELDADLGIVENALGGYKLWVGTTDELNAIEERDPNTIYFEVSSNMAYVDINTGMEESEGGIATTDYMFGGIPAYSGEEPVGEVNQDVILTSPSGYKFKLVVDDYGMLSTIPVIE
jgi:hypothetical protein